MTEHTPGPWRVCEHSWSDSGVYAGDDRVAGLSIRDEATEDNQEALEATMDANARLIAAAPCLLEALREIESHRGSRDDDGELIDSICDLAKEAIAKATGEEADDE